MDGSGEGDQRENKLGRLAALRSWSKMLRAPQTNRNRIRTIAGTAFVLLVWVAGLAAAIYLIYNALYLLFLAVVFGFNAPPTHVLPYLAFVGTNAIPAACFLVIGLTGILLWPSERFWPLGLSAVVIETALAIYDIANPNSMMILSLVPM